VISTLLEGFFDGRQLAEVATRVLCALGAPAPTAATVAESLAESNLVGHDSHGIVRLMQYSGWIRQGQIRPDGVASLSRRNRATAVVDGGWGFGQPAARLATAITIEVVAEHGVAATTISSCNHIGRLGEYLRTTAEAGLIAIAFCNSRPLVAPYGGRAKVMGTNPLAWSVPRESGPAIVLDFATANVAEGKLKLALAEGKTVAPGSIIDRNGKPSVDPAEFYKGGALLPFGAHKGSGISMLIELTAGLLSGMGASCAEQYLGGNGTVIVALDVAAFLPLSEYFAQVEKFCTDLKLIGGNSGTEVLLPGESEWRTRRERETTGVRVAAETRREITFIADRCGAEIGDFGLRDAKPRRAKLD
jgi:LDH2 family malate/lactate/ureidoglycolate dehydrogenase